MFIHGSKTVLQMIPKEPQDLPGPGWVQGIEGFLFLYGEDLLPLLNLDQHQLYKASLLGIAGILLLLFWSCDIMGVGLGSEGQGNRSLNLPSRCASNSIRSDPKSMWVLPSTWATVVGSPKA